MAPGRKRGSNRTKHGRQLNLGDLVLAKVKGFPAWPAKISRPEDWNLPPDPKKYFVEFFGTKEIGFVALTEIQEFSAELKNKLFAKCEGKALKPFTLAVKDISEAFERLGEKCSTDSRVVGSVESTRMQQSYTPLRLEKGKAVIGTVKVPVSAGEMEESEVDGSKGNDAKCSLQDKSDTCSQNGMCTPSGVADDISKTVFTEKGNATVHDEMHQSRMDVEFTPGLVSTSEVSSCRKGADKLFHRGNLKVAKAKRSKRLASNGCSMVKRFVGIRRNSNIQDEILNKNLSDNSKKNDMLEPIDVCEQENDMILNNRKFFGNGVITEKKGLFHIANGKPDGVTNGASDAVEKSKCSHPDVETTEKASAKERMHNSLVYKSDVDKSDDRHESPNYIKTENNLDHEQSGGHSDIMTNQFMASGEGLMRSKNEEIFLGNQLQTGEGGSISIDIEDGARIPVNGCSTGNSNVFTSVLDVSSSAIQNKQNYYSPQLHAGSLIRDNDGVECEQPIRTVGVSLSPDVHQIARSGSMKTSTCQLKCKVETSSSEKIDMAIFSPKKSPFTTSSPRTVRPQFSAAKTEVSISCDQTHASSVFSTCLVMVSRGSSDQVTSQMNYLVFEEEKNKRTHKEILPCIAAEDALNDNIFSGGRTEGHKLAPLADSTDLDTSMSMKHLIAVAHAKRRQNQSTDHDRPVVQNQFDIEVVREGRHSSGDNVSGCSFSSGTEAAVARDAFEGMLETLTRTKESIGRATRLAIDCAKHGIANEVVDIVTQKLESESSFHRKVDLFFLVDSITQCSHSQKGIPGASYIPTVQAALPRLLRATAPRGASARENRRQCLKVLRLWIERSIMPESLLRHYIDNIRTCSDDLIGGAFVKRPCRNERPLDDPVREMEGMLVDEYGSNATFQFPGLFAHVFEKEDNGLSNKIDGDVSPAEPVDSAALSEICESPIVDKHQCILEGVDGELEMEDACCNSKEERSALMDTCMHLQDEGRGGVLTPHMNSIDMDSLQEGFPPLPSESPPQIPSPPPLSLLQPPPSAGASPSLRPPPPHPLSGFSSQYTHFPSQPSAHPSHRPALSSQPTSFPGQPLFSCQLPLIPCQWHPPPVPVSMASFQLPAPLPQRVAPLYQPPLPTCQSPLPLSQPLPQTAQPSLPPSEPSRYPFMLPPPLLPPAHPSVPPFVPPSEHSSYWSSRPVDSGNNPHPINSSQQCRVGIVPIAQRPLYPTAVPHGPCTRSSHGSLHSFQCLSSERGPMSSACLNVVCQQGWWMGNGRTSCPPHVQVGNVRSQMMPMGQAMSAGNCWRPP